MSGLLPGIFIDRDDVINKCPAGIPGDPAGYITRWDQFEFYEDVGMAFTKMYIMPYKVFVVSNQSGISRETIECTEESIRKIFSSMEWTLTNAVNCRIADGPIHNVPLASQTDLRFNSANGAVVITESLFCPHLDEHNCACRKPKPGMIWHLAVKHRIDLGRSWMIGDSHSDIMAGWNAGIRRMVRIDHDAEPLLLKVGDQVTLPKNSTDVLRVPSLLNAVGIIQAYDAWIEKVWGKKK